MSQSKDQDQSMEEILQSIKRIIAEEGTPASPGSEVLELTDIIEDTAMGASPLANPPALGSMSIDEIMAAPLATGTPEPAIEPEPFTAPAPAPEPEPEPFVAAAPEPAAPAPKPAPAPAPAPVSTLPEGPALVSDATLDSAAAALAALKSIPEKSTPAFQPTAAAGFRSGITVEDLVMEALRPMIREWLEANLPGITRELVEREVRKLSSRV